MSAADKPMFRRSESGPGRKIARLIWWMLIYATILFHIHPELILSQAWPTGGDTATHFQAAMYFKEHLLANWRIVGWNPGNYAGFPQFQLYFPLPFLLMRLLTVGASLAVAFKIVTVLGALLLPPSAYFFMRRLGYRYPAPDLAAIFSLGFLFMEANSAWGGNLLSSLAGEFSYSLALALALIYLGRMYADIDESKHVVLNAVLLAATGLCHGYPLLFCIAGTAFFLVTTENWLERFAYVLSVNLLAFCFMGFWIVPLLVFSKYATVFNFVWIIHDIWEVVPVILWPFCVLALISAVSGVLAVADRELQRRTWFLLFLILAAVVLYLVAFKIGVVDVRFLPFAQIFVVLLAAGVAGRIIGVFKIQALIILLLASGAAFWSFHHQSNIQKWSAWNYSGWENKPLYASFNAVNEHLRGDFSRPRVVYEHNSVLAGAGTVRAFECLPLFSGRATLEGAYIQACLSSPAVFYLQSEISEEISAPLNQINYSRFDLEKALPHLRLFNVGHYITASQEAMQRAMVTDGYKLEAQYGPLAVFRITAHPGRYVEQPLYRPIIKVTDNPKSDSFQWFRQGDPDVPLVLVESESDVEAPQFAAAYGKQDLAKILKDPERLKLPGPGDLSEKVTAEEIIIDGVSPGIPLLIKVSYHPNWHVDGAARIWRAAPSFMLVFPETNQVRLYYAWTWPDYLGLALTILGILYAAWLFWTWREVTPFMAWFMARMEPLARWARPKRPLLLGLALTAISGGIIYLAVFVSYQDPGVYFNRGRACFDQGDIEKARAIFTEAAERFPYSPVIGQTLHHLALTYYNQGDYQQARDTWIKLVKNYPESRVLPHAWYHIGLSYLKQDMSDQAANAFYNVVSQCRDSVLADEATRRLVELEDRSWDERFDRAVKLLRQKKYGQASALMTSLRDQAPRRVLEAKAAYYLAMFHMQAGERLRGRAALWDLARDYPDTTYAEKAEELLKEAP
jgi:TolA-binding protein